MVVRETAGRLLSSSELALVSGGGTLLAATAMVAVSSKAMAADYDLYCGNGLKPGPIPHFTGAIAGLAAHA